MQLIGGILWLGGVLGLCAIDLATLSVGLVVNTSSPVMGLRVVSTNHLLSACLDGQLKVIDAFTAAESFNSNISALDSGNERLGNVISMDVVLSASGKMSAVLGQREGLVKVLDLPEMSFRASLSALAKTADVRCIVNAGADGLFLVGGSDGTLALWKAL